MRFGASASDRHFETALKNCCSVTGLFNANDTVDVLNQKIRDLNSGGVQRILQEQIEKLRRDPLKSSGSEIKDLELVSSMIESDMKVRPDILQFRKMLGKIYPREMVQRPREAAMHPSLLDEDFRELLNSRALSDSENLFFDRSKTKRYLDNLPDSVFGKRGSDLGFFKVTTGELIYGEKISGETLTRGRFENGVLKEGIIMEGDSMTFVFTDRDVAKRVVGTIAGDNIRTNEVRTRKQALLEEVMWPQH
jgi:hypothetical protein